MKFIKITAVTPHYICESESRYSIKKVGKDWIVFDTDTPAHGHKIFTAKTLADCKAFLQEIVD